MTAVHTITLVCDGKSQVGCPSMSRLVVEASTNSEARRQASRMKGWSTRWAAFNDVSRQMRKMIDICAKCDPERRSTR